jgi:hypothetical protein
MPGYLATTTSSAESRFVIDQVLPDGHERDQFWLGGFRSQDPNLPPDEGWSWITGEAWSFTNWQPLAPNAAPNEWYLSAWLGEGVLHPGGPDRRGAWNDAPVIPLYTPQVGYLAEFSDSGPTFPDSDEDGRPDLFDNCPAVSNPDQGDADLDLLGDACDPFPDNPDNDLAQCQLDLEQCLDRPVFIDEDGDGEDDSTDACLATPESSPVDAAGCSQAEFCGAIGARTLGQIFRCVLSDWRNDEPFQRVPRDCRVNWRTRECMVR